MTSLIVNASEPDDPKVAIASRFSRNYGTAEEIPVVEYTAHNRGNMQLAIGNNGTFGTFGQTIIDPLSGDAIPSCIYPRNSDIVFLWVGALWVGAIVGRDTLVSCATEDWYITSEFWPDLKPRGDFTYRSIDVNSSFFSPLAKSEQDIICTYTDTLTDPSLVAVDPVDQRLHRPLNIKVEQRTMAWSYPYADDFVLFDYNIQNIGFEDLHDVYLGIFVDGDVWHTTRNGPQGWNDDIVGFLRTHPARGGCDFIDTINVAFTADNDGDPDGGRWDYRSTLGVVGSRVVRTPSDSLKYSYNWWIINYGDVTRDFGPRRQPTDDAPFRNLNNRLGTPRGDKNKYYVMSHDEFDYDLMYLAIDQSANGWMPPPQFARQFAEGYDARYLLSFGPFDINPGQQLPISFVWVGGEGFHVKPNDFEKLFDSKNPDAYYQSLNFDNLAENAMWASWVYDNPGVDTDGDGYRGKFRICDDDTIFYEGDGVPDFSGASPPPPPTFTVYPDIGSLRIRFNGFHSETARDVFSGIVDFEGYRVYIARDDRRSSFSMVASFDRENFNKFIVVVVDTTWLLNDAGDTTGFQIDRTGRTVLKDPPFTLDSLRCLYAPDSCEDSSFDPLIYSQYNPFEFGDSLFYFQAQDFNVSRLGLETPIIKVYPNAAYPSSFNPDSVNADQLTEKGEFKYFEYEVTIDSLLPTVPYFVNVTAFDFGSPAADLKSLESSVLVGVQEAFPLSSADKVVTENLDAYVYPNPYRIDGGYSFASFENRQGNLATERARRIHFANLPATCVIRIYSLDGDMVREIIHDKDPSDPTASHDSWDMITRNTQSVVSGLYYFSVQSDTRTQIGKLVILK